MGVCPQEELAQELLLGWDEVQGLAQVLGLVLEWDLEVFLEWDQHMCW